MKIKNHLPHTPRPAGIWAAFFLMVSFSCQGISQEKPAMEDSAKKEKPVGRGEGLKSRETSFPISKSEAEWKAQLTEAQYKVLRKAGTEYAFTSPLLKEKRNGTFRCAACGHELYESRHKFTSGTGWPSFDRAIDGGVGYDVDYKIGYKRTEVHCARCGGHLGHVFEDGPRETTGLRHCINGVALEFTPAE